MIELDVANRRLHLDISEEELAQRRESWLPPQPLAARGYVQLYIEHVMQASKGADLDFLVGRSGAEVTRDSH
jgi:dihydroxy-acid dehydratase